MRTLDQAVALHLSQRGPTHAHLLINVQGRNRETEEAETIGFWTGADHETFIVEGQPTSFFGAGTLMKINPLVSEAGVNVRTTRVEFSAIPPEVQLAVRGYDIRRQPCRIYVAYFNAETMEPIGSPQRVFKGFSMGLELIRPEPGGSADMTLNLMSAARQLTRTLSLKKSRTALLARVPGDGFRDFSDISGAVEAVWGEIRSTGPAPSRPPVQDVDNGR
jgi:hypothetical protein